MTMLRSLQLWIGNVAGTILDVVFGWAVRALFRQPLARDRRWLTALVAVAATWPLLVLGAVFLWIAGPVGSLPGRVVWTVCALWVPLMVGHAVASGDAAAESAAGAPEWKRMLRGFPITMGLAGAFLILLLSVPVARGIALLRRQRTVNLPLVTDAASYSQVAAMTWVALNQHGFQLQPAQPSWWVAAPLRILGRLGGGVFGAFVPPKLEQFATPDLEVSFRPRAIVLTGKRSKVYWARGVITEVLAHSDGLQTVAPAAQELERLIHRVWLVHDEIADNAPNRGRLLEMVDRIARRLGGVDVGLDDWQVLYRQLMQVERAVRGQGQILEENSAFARIGAAETYYASGGASSDHDTRPDLRHEAEAAVALAAHGPGDLSGLF